MRRQSTLEARESDPHSAEVAPSPAARWFPASHFLTSASASCQLCHLRPLRVPRLVVPVSDASSFLSALMGNVSTSRRGTRARSLTWYDLGIDASARSRRVRTRRLTVRRAVYLHSSLIEEEEVSRFSFLFHYDKIKPSHTGMNPDYITCLFTPCSPP